MMSKIVIGTILFSLGLFVCYGLGDYHGHVTFLSDAKFLGCGLIGEDGKTTFSWRQRADGSCVMSDLYKAAMMSTVQNPSADWRR